MKHLLLALLLVSFPLVAQERADLTTPETKPSNAAYHIGFTSEDWDAGLLTIALKGQNGEVKTCLYSASTTPTGLFLLNGLNKANLSSAYAGNATTGSYKQRIFHRLVVMGEAAQVCGGAIVGSLTGTVP